MSAICQKQTSVARTFAVINCMAEEPDIFYANPEQTIVYVLDLDSLQHCGNGALLAIGISHMAN